MTTTILLGIDVGTTDSKVLATTTDGTEIVVCRAATSWTARADGWVDTDPIALADNVIALAARTVRAAQERLGPVSVGGLAVTGMAETGALLDESGRSLTPAIAWFDPRGTEQLAALPAAFTDQIPAITGLPCDAQMTLAKLLWFKEFGVQLTAGTWLHLPELIVHRLGAARYAETSLLARTGLYDQGAGDLWPPALDLLGIDSSFFPPQVDAGSPLGLAEGAHCPPELAGAVLAVAGHDHPVAAVGCGAVGAGELLDSFGTAQVYLLTLDEPVAPEHRARLVAGGINAVRHAVPGRWHLMANTKAGLLLRRTLALLGVDDDTSRAALDSAAVAAFDTETVGVLEVSGAANDDGVLRISAVSDQVTPTLVWLAALRHGVATAHRLLGTMTAEFGPPAATVVTGGWTRMESVRREKLRLLQHVRFAHRQQAGAFGAAAFAAHAHRTGPGYGPPPAGPTPADLTQFAAQGADRSAVPTS